MDDDADTGRELERLRAELTEFVLDAVAERLANGAEPKLSAALVEAIGRRVDQSVESRVADLRWPNPQAFADDVIAAARRSGGGEDRPRGASRATAGSPGRRGGSMLPFLLGLASGLAVALVAWLVYSSLQRQEPVQTNVQSPPITSGLENTSAGPVNVIVEGENQAARAAPQAPNP